MDVWNPPQKNRKNEPISAYGLGASKKVAPPFPQEGYGRPPPPVGANPFFPPKFPPFTLEKKENPYLKLAKKLEKFFEKPSKEKNPNPQDPGGEKNLGRTFYHFPFRPVW